jgi:hypothetical protein
MTILGWPSTGAIAAWRWRRVSLMKAMPAAWKVSIGISGRYGPAKMPALIGRSLNLPSGPGLCPAVETLLINCSMMAR